LLRKQGFACSPGEKDDGNQKYQNSHDKVNVDPGHSDWPFIKSGNICMEVTVEHYRQHTPARVVKLPFYEPEWKRN